jgi:hypothetical protein
VWRSRANRDSVELHYGRDDFADDARLARVLSGDRSKDMATDYERDAATLGPLKTEPPPNMPEPQAELEHHNEGDPELRDVCRLDENGRGGAFGGAWIIGRPVSLTSTKNDNFT